VNRDNSAFVEAVSEMRCAMKSRDTDTLVRYASSELEDDAARLAARAIAARYLGKIGGESAIQALIHLLDDPNLDVRLTAVRSLSRLRARLAGDLILARLRAATDPAEQYWLLRAVARVVPDEASAAEPFIDHENRRLRSAARRAVRRRRWLRRRRHVEKRP